MADELACANETASGATTARKSAGGAGWTNALWQLIPDTLLRITRSGEILDFKPGDCCQLLALPLAEAGRNVADVLPPLPARTVIKAIEATVDTREPRLVELDFTKCGKTAWVECRVAPTAGAEVLVFLRDISEQRSAEACEMLRLDIGLKMQETRPLEEILSLACKRLAAIYALPLVWAGYREQDAPRNVFSSSGEAVSRVQAFTARGRDFIEGDELTATAIRTGKFQLMAIEDPRMAVWRQRLAAYSATSGAAYPLKIAGQTLGALTVFATDRDFWTKRTILRFTDVAEQLALAVDVNDNRRRLKLLTTGLESAANAIMIANPEGNIQWANPAFLSLNGYSAAEVLGNSVRMLKSQYHSRAFYKLLWRYVSAGRIWFGEVVNARKDGSVYTAEMTITPVREETGQITNFIAIIQDITERKQAEWAMLDARETVSRAERLSALGIMAGGIAHEINQPLNSLKVLADGMLYWQRQGKTPQVETVMENVQEISRQADRIDMIIKHMRSFINSGDTGQALPCDLNEAVEQSLSLMGSQLMSHEIEVTTDLAEWLPPLYGNSIQLEQVMINLLSNAMQALDTIDKACKQIRITTKRGSNQVQLTVSDNGPGISQAIKDKIFDPFFTTKSAGGGMGLGLSIVHSIIAAFGGSIKIKANKPVGGVIFQIEFPVTPGKLAGGV
ncbi:MAG: PAS domain S-box protein [Negativicutes bacterium]|nr:PAS domain S-box protein [Negativicutes bacterium]